MKKLLVLAAVLAIIYYFYQQGDFPTLNFQAASPSLEPLKPSATHDFNAVSNMLKQDMESLPADLDGNASRPVHAYDVKRAVRAHLNEHVEYQTLTQVCDLIIQADTERNSLQQSRNAEQHRTTFHSSLESDDKKQTAPPAPSGNQAAIRQRMDSTWSEYRSQTSAKVDRLLGTLKDKTI